MRIFRAFGAIALIPAVLFAVGVMTVAAQGPVGDSPATAPFIDNASHTMAANSSMWFRFNYSLGESERPISTITLANGNRPGIGLEVWTQEALNGSADNKPVGRGGFRRINCDTGAFSAQGDCQTTDLAWVGAFGMSGTYYVRIVNDSPSPANILLTISGSGVGLATPTTTVAGAAASPTRLLAAALPTPSATLVPSAHTAPPTPVIMPNVDDPNRSILIDGLPHILAANSATWFRFNYYRSAEAGTRLKDVRLINGNGSGVRFEVWPPNHVNDWWDGNKPVGRGTVYMLDCDTHEYSEYGDCPSPDLIWMGSFRFDDYIYIRVVNDNPQPTYFTLQKN
jgi:hypothetical protein